jgi:hypothetical protein
MKKKKSNILKDDELDAKIYIIRFYHDYYFINLFSFIND